MSQQHAVNSLDWWNEYFVQQWESNNGRGQTRYFMSCLFDHLGSREYEWLRRGHWSILDWGCALGDGVDVVAKRLPNCEPTGLDFSATAIAKARIAYPNYRFLLASPDGAVPEADVIITSNCLEHFEAPLEIAASQIRGCRFLYLAMVPHREVHLHESHVGSFDTQTFPDSIGAFRKLGSSVFRCVPKYWDGEQLLVRYGSPEYCEQLDRLG